jgi:UDP-2,3-diacylglucosamine pyrophosphatase LpxH
MSSIQIISDLHIEKLPENTPIEYFNGMIKPTASILCLLGDIFNLENHNYVTFFESLKNKFNYVLVIPGNHEYYCLSEIKNKEEIDVIINAICEQYKFIFLNNKSVIIDGIRFIGTTLWSYVDIHHKKYIEGYMNDYKYIYSSGSLISSNYINFHFERSLAFIMQEMIYGIINNNINVVLTRHAPLLNECVSKKFENSESNCAFGTNLQNIIDKKTIQLWCCGHTHNNFNFEINNVRIVSNQRGYPQSVLKTYKNDFCININNNHHVMY